MELPETLLLATGLAMDAFAVSLAASAQGVVHANRRGWIAGASMVAHFGVFQAGMTLLGWAVGMRVATWITAIDHWIAFGLLAAVGVHMIRDGLGHGDEDRRLDLTRWWTILTLAVATSIDALAVGLGLAFLEVDARGPSITIGAVTALLSLVGVLTGRALGSSFGDRMQVIGGAVLLFIGTRILVTHLLG